MNSVHDLDTHSGKVRLRYFVTGGAGFIGSALVRHLVGDCDQTVCCFDKLTYSGSELNVAEVASHPQFEFVHGDICARDQLRDAVLGFKPDVVFNLAAESHVDRSIDGPGDFIQTNIVGTYHLLEVFRELSTNSPDVRLIHISTDEVFGSLGAEGWFSEESPYRPNSPYSASKASSDHLVRAWIETYQIPAMLTNCSNNYGPYQFPEKLIPLIIRNVERDKPVPIYGDGLQVRDWLYVDDHVRALGCVADQGQLGRTYNVGANCEKTNIEVVKEVIRAVARELGRSEDHLLSRIEHVADRPGHDQRYAIDASRIRSELSWQPEMKFVDGIDQTVRWFLANGQWCDEVSGDYDGGRLGMLEGPHQ